MKAPSYFQKIAPRGTRAAPPAPLPRLQPAPPLFRQTPGSLAFVEALEERVVGSRPATRSAAPSPSAASVPPATVAATPSRQAISATPPVGAPISRTPSAAAAAHPIVAAPASKPAAGRVAGKLQGKPAAPPSASPAAPFNGPTGAARAPAPSGSGINRLEPAASSPTSLAPPSVVTAVTRQTPVTETSQRRTPMSDRDDGRAAAPRDTERRGVEHLPEPPRSTPAANAPTPAAPMTRIAPEPPAPRPPRATPAKAASAPSIHIGLLEVRVTTPAPAPLPLVARPAARTPPGRAPAAPSRVARSLGVYGLGQS
jgi:hypothetical protein